MRRSGLLWCVAISVASVAFYLNAFGNELVYDDISIIRDNLRIRSLSNLGEWFTTNYRGIQNDGLYRPVVLMSFAFNYALSGLQTWSYTAVNVALHAAVCLTLFGLVRSLGAQLGAAGAAGLLFAVHPVHTEAVTAFVGRADTLAALFFLLTLWAHRKIPAVATAQRNRLRIAGWIAALLAFLSKESAITLLAVVPAMDLLLPPKDLAGHRVSWPTRLRRDYPGYAVAAALYLGARFVVLGGVSLGQQIMPLDNPMVTTQLRTALGNTYGATWAQSLLTPFAVLAEYLRLLIWPVSLSADYSYDQIALASSPLDPRVLVGVGFTVAVLAGILLLRTRAPIAAFGLVFAALTFAVTSNVVIKIGTICAERLVYLPSAGLLLVVAIGWERFRSGGAVWRRQAAWVLLAAVALAAGGRTWARNPDWRDELALWSSAVKVVPDSAKANSNYANFSLREAGRIREQDPVRADRLIAEAESHLERALEIYPDYPEASSTLGRVYVERGRYADAGRAFETAIRISPGFHRAHTNWAVLQIRQLTELRQRFTRLREAGNEREAARLRDQAGPLARHAEQNLDRAIELDPTSAMAYFNRAVLYKDHLSQPAKAVADLRTFLQLRPNDPRRSAVEREIALLQR